jgi:hypothetical protein
MLVDVPFPGAGRPLDASAKDICLSGTGVDLERDMHHRQRLAGIAEITWTCIRFGIMPTIQNACAQGPGAERMHYLTTISLICYSRLHS